VWKADWERKSERESERETMEKRERRSAAQQGNLKRKRAPPTTLTHVRRGNLKSVSGELQPLRR
jgi:hypothetical protein